MTAVHHIVKTEPPALIYTLIISVYVLPNTLVTLVTKTLTSALCMKMCVLKERSASTLLVHSDARYQISMSAARQVVITEAPALTNTSGSHVPALPNTLVEIVKKLWTSALCMKVPAPKERCA